MRRQSTRLVHVSGAYSGMHYNPEKLGKLGQCIPGLGLGMRLMPRWRDTKLMIFITFASSYTFLAMGICADGISVCSAVSLSTDGLRS